jgi:hypothetical protein
MHAGRVRTFGAVSISGKLGNVSDLWARVVPGPYLRYFESFGVKSS